ncbi:MAG: hypothetical protein AB8H86_24615, partial [Polyangiales bacterium]
MNFARHLAFLSVLLGTSGALAQTTNVDFDTFPGGAAVPSGTEITNQYPGVTFSSSTENCRAITTQPASPPNALS